MKLATYYRTRGDNVIFFKGALRDLATELVCDKFFYGFKFIKGI